MPTQSISIRPFIGAKNFEESRNFYRNWGFEEVTISPEMSLFKTGQLSFYLQKYYVQDWIDNTMLFLEVDNVDQYWKDLLTLNLTAKHPNIKLSTVRVEYWGKECFVHDPSGVLWHIGEFFKT